MENSISVWIPVVAIASMGFMELMLYLSTLSFKEYVVETVTKEVVKVATFPVSPLPITKIESSESVMNYAKFTPHSGISEHRLLSTSDYKIEILTYEGKDYFHINNQGDGH